MELEPAAAAVAPVGLVGQPPKFNHDRKKQPIPVRLRSLLLTTVVLATAFGLFCVAFSTELPPTMQFFPFLGGLLLCGAVIGAVVGHASNTKHGSRARQRATVGAIAFAVPLLLYAAFQALLDFALWHNFIPPG
jgi:hypothetical protein